MVKTGSGSQVGRRWGRVGQEERHMVGQGERIRGEGGGGRGRKVGGGGEEGSVGRGSG
jgi:hypothetical protein